ncbi:Ribosomal RNA small subunit methyltransferase F [bioreactor metagenome]|jgi:16S rRNA C967 or C1407 C5-methylase (RsmB/RsmF family)/NOL1/NOP2/fmu family ribosome biogenesis protein|uniref:Ribosomal RNA small subunit methyltransferase F n=1 Tax=bioreactor metagenome TaxID=1076179 RepID=A0A644W1X7_9ZZZZ|nr:rRNA cytosine-C5-methyltransferase [Paludibacter sp.]
MLELPVKFVDRTKSLLGDEYPAFEEALNGIPPVSIRVNDKFTDYKPSDQIVPWCDSGFYLNERPLFTADPLLHAGVYYVQEASSMFLKQVCDVYMKNAERVLDLCAAPGGKSTLLSQALPSEALLVSNEIVRSRAMILAENVIKWGNPNVVVTNNTPEDFSKLPAFFDAIVVDAPCSGEGMFRKDPGSVAEWSLQNVQQCAIRQKSILKDVWQSLKDGGILVYSTCTYNKEENEDNVAWICEELGADCLTPDISDFDGIVVSEYGCRFYPHKIKGEGFFIAVLRKYNMGESINIGKSKKNKQQDKYVDRSDDFRIQVLFPNNFIIKEIENRIVAFQQKHLADVLDIDNKLNCLVNGIQLAEIKGKDFIPAHQLALSKIISKEAFLSVELELREAIAFLKRESIVMPENTPRGYVLVCYQEQALGWVKNLGNRSNNLYPQHWRIRMHL